MGLGKLFGSQSIALDTNIFISASNEKNSNNKITRTLLAQIERISPKVTISVILLEEFFVRIYKQNQDENISSILDFITLGGKCTVVDIDSQIALLAAKLRAKYTSLRGPDAIHLASAIERKAKVFITTDKRLPRKIGNLKIEVIS